jgi:hypothetical protein
MRFSMRFWRPDRESTSSWLGNSWLTVPGVIADVKGGVFPSTRDNGIYVNFGNATAITDDKGVKTYGKPVLTLDPKLQDAANAVVNQFWDTSLNKVELELADDGSISIVEPERKVSAIKGADDLIKASLNMQRTMHKKVKAEVEDTSVADAEAAI